MNRLLLLMLSCLVWGCGQKDEGATRIENKEKENVVAPGPGKGGVDRSTEPVDERSLAEYIKNKRFHVLTDKGDVDLTGFGQFYGNGTWQSGIIIDGVATTSGGVDEKGRYEVDELTVTLVSEDGEEDLLDFSSPEPVANDKFTITKDDGNQEIVTIIKVEDAGIVQVTSAPTKGGVDAGNIEELLGAMITGDTKALETFLESGGDVNAREPDKERNSLMHIAVTFGQAGAVKVLAKSGANLDIKNTNGTTPLISAGFLGKSELVKILIDEGASLDVTDNNGMTALDAAAMSWEDAKGIVDFLNLAIFVPLGSPLDPDEVRAGREDCVDILRDAKK